MATTNLGTVAVHGEGDWSVSNAYTKLSIVAYNGGSYMAVQDVPAGTSLTDESYWMPISDTRETVRELIEQHPEWVTTVEDGSITAAKLAPELAADIAEIDSLSTRADAADADISTAKNDIDVLDARMAQIEAGTTPEGSEITDVRVGYDGTTYADAGTAVRMQVADIHNTLGFVADDTNHATVTEGLDTTAAGVTLRRVDDTTMAVFGTATSGRRFLFLNGNNYAATTTSAFIKTFDAGTYQFRIRRNGSPTPLRYTYTTFSSGNEVVIHDGDTVTFTAPAMVGWVFSTGTNYGTEDEPTIITVSAKTATARDEIARAGISEVRTLAVGAVMFGTDQTLSDAEKQKARNNIDAVGNDTLYRYNYYNALENSHADSSYSAGISFTKNGDGSWTVSGTSTATTFKNLLSSAAAVPPYIIKGRKYRLKFNGGTVPLRLYIYAGGTSSFKDYNADADIEFPADMTGMLLRFQITSGKTYDETVMYELVPTDAFGDIWIDAVDTDTEDETGKTDMTGAIMAMLNSTGYCHLGEGIFYVSGNIDMPYHSTLEGCGDKTTIRLLQSVESGYVIRPTQYCTIKNLGISGGYSAPTFGGTIGTRHGINWFANADGEEATQPDVLHSVIDGVFIRNFSGSGIRLHNTGLNYAHSLYVANSMISRCYIGINIDYYSEFNKFCNIGMYWCKIACQNNGGNNAFSNCTFHATDTGFIIDNSDGKARNNAHGLLTNGTFCHIGSNAGKAIVVRGVGGGYIFNACQVHYNSIEVEDSSGIVFSNFQFGRGTTGRGAVIHVTGGNLVMFNGCMFANDIDYPPQITVTNNTKTRFVNCYGGVSGEEITA